MVAMGLPIVSRWIRADEFATDPIFEHGHYILDGDVHPDMGNAQRTHELVKSALLEALIFCLRNQQIRGRVFVETAYQLTDYTVLIPDVSVQLPEREAGSGLFQGSPEIAIEILSPANSKRELDVKARAFWAHGAKAVWVLDPEHRKIYSVTRTGEWMETDRLEVAEFPVDVDTANLWPVDDSAG
jgi:Uma2 family endonuclease